jgi:ACS family hexuronate transporter-like MFS transporter
LSTAPRWRCWILIGLLFGATALSYLDRQVLSVLAPQIMAEFRMGNTAYSRVVFAFVFSYTAMFALGGRFIDAVGTKLGLGLSVLVWSVASGLHGLATGPWTLGASRFLLGAGAGPCFPAAAKGAVEWTPPKHRALAIGIANAGSAFGAMLAPPLTAWSAGALGWRTAFFGTAVIGALWLCAWLAAFRGLAPGEREKTAAPACVGRLLADRNMRRLMLARCFFDPVFYFYLFWIPQYLSQERGLSLAAIGSLTWIPFFALGVANIAAGRLSDVLVVRGWQPRRARLALMLAAAMLTPASFLASIADNVATAIALMSVLMLAHGIWIANFVTLVGDSVTANDVGTAVGLTGACGGIAGMFSSLITGPVADHFSFAAIFVATAVLYPVAWLILALPHSPRADA